MREIEARSEAEDVSTDALMERAGLEAARRVRYHVGHLIGVPILVLVGPGNNGGDGLVAARRLHAWEARVTAALCTHRREPDPKADRLRDWGVPVVEAWDEGGVSRLRELLARSHAVIDAVLGTGRSRPIGGSLREALLAVENRTGAALRTAGYCAGRAFRSGRGHRQRGRGLSGGRRYGGVWLRQGRALPASGRGTEWARSKSSISACLPVWTTT